LIAFFLLTLVFRRFPAFSHKAITYNGSNKRHRDSWSAKAGCALVGRQETHQPEHYRWSGHHYDDQQQATQLCLG
jgi:hypothetical protein